MALPDLSVLLSLLLVASPTLVSAATCSPGHYNASGSVNLPFPHPPTFSPSDPSGNYTLSTQLSFPAGPLGVSQSFRAVNASGYAVNSKPLDYEGCFIVFGDSFWPVTQGHINEPDQASCQSAFSSACISKIISYASQTASGFSQQNLPASMACSQFTVPTCAKVANIYSSPIFTTVADGLSTSSSNNSSSNSSTNCQAGELFSLSGLMDGNELSTYLKKLHSVTPVMVVAWNNASSNPGGNPWSDTRFFCMSTNKISPGSKSGAPSTGPAWPGWYLASFSSIIGVLSFIV